MFTNSLLPENLQLTIIRHPLIVNSEILLPDVVALINQAPGNFVGVPIKDTNYLKNSSKDIDSNTSQAASCVLVMENSQLVGIITQGDLIKLAAQGKNLEDLSVAEVMTRELITLKLRDFKDIFTALNLLRQHQICHLPIVGDQGELIGLVTPTSLLAVSIQQARLYNYARVKLAERQRIEAELRLERNFVSAVLNLADALVVVLDFQGRIIRFNHTCEQATGYAFDEVKGRFVWDVMLSPETTECIKAIFKNLAETEIPQRYETCLVTKDSDRRLISWSTKVLLNQDNQVDYIVCTGIDITESRKAQEELKQTRNFLQSMINNLPVAVFVKDAKPDNFGTFKLWNHTCEHIFGITAEQAIGKTDYEFFPKEQADFIRQKDQETVDSGVPQDISEEPIDSPTFDRRILHTTKIPLYDKDKQPEYLLYISEDITEYKRAEKNLQQAKEQLQTVLDAVPGFVSWVNSDGYYLGVNRHLAESFNLTTDAFVGQELGFMKNSQQFTEFMREFLARPDVADSSVIDAQINGKTRNYLLVAQKYQQNTAAVAVGIDITKRKQAEIALQSLIESTASTTGRDFFPALVEHISSTLDVRHTLVSELIDGQVHTLGFWSDGQLQPNICYDPKSTPCEILLKQGFYYCASGIQSLFPNAERWVAMQAESSMGVILSDDLGQPIGLLCIVDEKPIPDHDRFEGILKVFAARASAELQRQRAQEALQKLNQDLEVRVKQRTLDLQKSEAELRAIFHQAAVGIKLETLDGNFIKGNQKLCEILGYSQEEILNKNFRNITYPEDIQVYLNKLQELIAGGVEIFSIEKRYLHKNGNVIWVNLTVSLIRDPVGKPIYVIGVVKDIRDRKQAEEDIRKALEKEKELSELKSRFISMTSHEFRTPLAVITSSAGILKSFSHKLDEQQKQKHLQCIQTYVQHTTQLLDDILLINKAEAGKLAFEPTCINLVDFCRSLVEEIQLSSPNHSLAFFPQYLGTSTDARFTPCMDKKLLRQILSNLLSNAVKYSPEGSNVQIDLLVQDKSAVFLIKDEGIGILPQEQQNLFEPFYRGSNVGNKPGTGLGLAIVNKCIDLHRGRITVASQVRVGTTFRVELPLITSNVLNETI
ncbi:PAS domain S-box protein [Iningainema tapete]|uniref:histidine kinase n=1 Tax=Iningainema tapete BLCC-T55 TaxID=2748662 RepID=A0A8J6XM21_9CYAN|nr:PAS domain S-box protein [Iningainema tapete]MBD2775602.1 PAS domain S-box protein [Iningainema tapete BLCC-T55]